MRSAPNWIGDMIRGTTHSAALVAAFSLLLLAGCAGPARKVEMQPATPEGARLMLEQLSAQSERFEGDFSFAVQALFYKATFFGQCYLEMPDRFAASLRAPLGIKVGDVVMDRGLYELNMGNGQVMSGGVESLDIEAMTGLPLPTDDLLVLFDPMPRPPSSDVRTIDFQVLGDDSLWLWLLDEQGMEHQIEFAPKKRLVTQETWTSSRGVVVLKKQYHQHSIADGVPLARQVKLAARGKIPVTVELTFNRVELNPRWKESPFQLKWTNRP